MITKKTKIKNRTGTADELQGSYQAPRFHHPYIVQIVQPIRYMSKLLHNGRDQICATFGATVGRKIESKLTIVLEEQPPPLSPNQYTIEKIYESSKHAILGEKCFTLSKQSTVPSRTKELYDEGLRFLKPSSYNLDDPHTYVLQKVSFTPSEEQTWRQLRVPILSNIRRSRVMND